MNTRIKADAWMYYSVGILGFIAFACAVAALVLIWMRQPVPDVMSFLGFLAAGSLVRLLISPLNYEIVD